MKNLQEKINVSCETLQDLKTYQDMLIAWQEKINLVSKSSIEQSWERHFVDSMQLFQYIPPDAKTLADFGSGAGFPGMVIAIMAKEKTPYLKVSLIESIGKKTVYLKFVSEATSTPVSIINERIEKLPPQKFDVITSRAMTCLTDLLKYAFVYCHKKTVCIFPKGKNYVSELSEAHKNWHFKCHIEPSLTSDESRILIITEISKKKEIKNAKNICRRQS